MRTIWQNPVWVWLDNNLGLNHAVQLHTEKPKGKFNGGKYIKVQICKPASQTQWASQGRRIFYIAENGKPHLSFTGSDTVDDTYKKCVIVECDKQLTDTTLAHH